MLLIREGPGTVVFVSEQGKEELLIWTDNFVPLNRALFCLPSLFLPRFFFGVHLLFRILISHISEIGPSRNPKSLQLRESLLPLSLFEAFESLLAGQAPVVTLIIRMSTSSESSKSIA